MAVFLCFSFSYVIRAEFEILFSFDRGQIQNNFVISSLNVILVYNWPLFFFFCSSAVLMLA